MITHDISVRIGNDNPDKNVSVKRHDTGVNFRVHLKTEKRFSKWRSEEKDYIIPHDAIAILKIAKPDKTYVMIDGSVSTSSVLFKTRKESTAFSVSGVSEAEISIYNANQRRITSATFYIEVTNECACDCDQDSGNYVDILGEQIKAAIDAAERAETAAKNAEDASGRTAYDVAVKNGFEGTEEEWLASLKGDPGKTPEKGVDYWTPEDIVQIVNDVLEALPDGDEVSY